MRNKLFLILFLVCVTGQISAQRYLSKVFDTVNVASDIPYGFNFNYKGDSTTLYLDVYNPKGDTVLNRPLVILAHGGSFVQGNRKATDISTLCTRLAEMGYVVASIQYRLGVGIGGGTTLEQEFEKAVWRATQDGRAAVRYFNKSIENGNPFHIDPNMFYAGGISAGGVLALHLAFLDTPSELALTQIDTLIHGGIEGNSGNPGYSSKVKGVVSLCGALSKVQYMNNNTNITLCNMHGTNDATVPYKTDYFKFFNSNVALLSGSFTVDSAANKLGMDTRLYTFEGADHVPFTGTSATQKLYMDTTVNYVARYLYKHVTGLVPTGFGSNQKAIHFNCFPNPTHEKMQVKFGSLQKRHIKIYSMQGALVHEQTSNEMEVDLPLSTLSVGTYFLQITEDNQQAFHKIILY
jgi:poly(3-hydroxybutyrate) depolymerase